jgi:uncharacterized protein (DUF1697 family)
VPTFVAFLRAVNVGGTGLVSMAELKERVAGLGYTKVSTLLNSGNLVFDARGTASGAQKKLSALLHGWLSLEIDVMVRSKAELAELVDANPFEGLQLEPGVTRYVAFLAERPPALTLPLVSEKHGFKLFELRGRDALVLSWPVKGRTSFPTALLAREVGVSTLRNWNTVLKCLATCGP